MDFDFLGAMPTPDVEGHPDVCHVLTFAIHDDGHAVVTAGTADPEALAEVLREIIRDFLENPSKIDHACGLERGGPPTEIPRWPELA